MSIASLTPLESIPTAAEVKVEAKHAGKGKKGAEKSQSLIQRLSEVAIRNMSEITADTWRRMEGYAKDSKLLDSGIFYANEYYFALKATASPRLEILKKKGNFYHGWCPTAYFSPIKDKRPMPPTGLLPSVYKIAPGKLPSDALQAFRKGPTFTACGEVCQLAYYEAIKEVLGTEKFNKLFAADSPTPLIIGYNVQENPINLLINMKTISLKNFTKGQIAYVQNVVIYGDKHLNGEASGFNLICLDDTPGKQKFLGFGLNPNGASVSEIREVLLREFNKSSIDFEIVTDEVGKKILFSVAQSCLERREKVKDSQLTLEEFIEAGGGELLDRVSIFDEKRISQLAKATNDMARKLFTQWAIEENRLGQLV
jgi:hypothetical protein